MISGCDWKMKLGFGGFGDDHLKFEKMMDVEEGAKVWDDERLMDKRE